MSGPPAASTPVHRARVVVPTSVTWRSGVFSGYTPAADEAFAAWRGEPIQTATDYLTSVTWAQISDPVRIIAAWQDDPDTQLVLSVPLWPQTGGDLVLAAAGAYDEYFVQLARSLVSAGRADTIIRLGWEFNTPYFRWGVHNGTQAAEYAQAWRRIVTGMRSVPGANFSFVWNPDLSTHGIDPAKAYPGNSYVDDIGLDVYDRGSSLFESAASRWHGLVTARYGLRWQARFASAHHKPVAYPEWGLVSRPGLSVAGGDDPTFIAGMNRWFATHDTDFEDYFNADPLDSVATFAITDPQFATAAALYRRLF